MKNVVIILIAIVLIFIIKSLFVSVYLVRNRLDTQNFGERFAEINKPYNFSFTPRHNNLNIIIFPLKNPGLINKNEFTLKIYSQTELIREMKFSGYNIGDSSDVKFQFEPIANSGSNALNVEIASNSYQNPIFINTGKDNKPSFRAYFRSLNKNEAVSDWQYSWQDRLVQNFPFFIIWIIMLLGIVVWSARNEKS